MKELSTEEKAKRYEEAIEKLHEIITMDNKPVNPKEIGEYLFPELKESEDEKMRKSIIYALRNGGFYDSDKTDEAIAWLEKQKEQEPDWSKEDELHIRELESLVKQVWAIAEHENDKDTIHKMSDLSFFLKTLKPQLKQAKQKPTEWSEEDETKLKSAFAFLRYTKIEGNEEIIAEIVDWLKSIKERVQPQNQWKPSEGQMIALHDLNLTGNISYAGQGQALIELYGQLKKL